MPTPRPEADMLHMQHANLVAVLARQHEAARLKAQRDARARRAAAARTAIEPEPRPARSTRPAPQVQRPRPV